MKVPFFIVSTLVASIASVALAGDSPPTLTIVIFGDSTVADYGTNKPGMNGWGQVIGAGFAPQVRVVIDQRLPPAPRPAEPPGRGPPLIGRVGCVEFPQPRPDSAP